MLRKLLTLLLTVLAIGVAPLRAFTPEDHAGEADRKAMREFADGRTGLVVWESRRPTGTDARKYRIWKRNLDGSGLDMISGTPNEDGYAHIGPRISPDGRHVVFAGKAWNSSYDDNVRTLFNGQYAAPPFDAWIVEIDPETLEAGAPRELKALRGRVGCAGEDHVFEWRDNRTLLVNLPEEGGVFGFDIFSERIGRKLMHCGRQNLILSPSANYAICAQGGGAGYRRVKREGGEIPAVQGVNKLSGCQVSISARDDWLVWMEKPSQLSRLNLRTKERSGLPQVKKRLPKGHNYVYFPSLSRDMTLLAIGGSDMHSHGYGDYEIFLFPWDPEQCKPAGNPVRYCFNDREQYPNADKKGGHALDRWPDVWVRNPEFAEAHADAFGAARISSYPNVSLEVLNTDTQTLEENDEVAQAVRQLEEYTQSMQDPERSAQSMQELKRFDKWAQRVLDRAKELENVSPPEALNLYKMIAEAFRGRQAGKAAEKRLLELRDNEAFIHETEAWNGYRQIRKLAGEFETPDEAKALASDPVFAQKNSKALSRIRSIFKRLQSEYPSTRATLESRSLIHRYDIEVDMPTAADQRVEAVIEGTLIRRSKPKSVDEIAPYTEALMTNEYQVDKVRSGELDADRIVAVHLAMREGELLPPARLKEGAKVRLKLGLWSAQNNYQSHPLADDIETVDATYYFVLDSKRLE